MIAATTRSQSIAAPAEARSVPHEFERTWKVRRLFVFGVEITNHGIGTVAGVEELAKRINEAAKNRVC